MVPKLDDQTLGLIHSHLPNFTPVIQAVKSSSRRENFGRLDLPAARGADYFFQVWLYEDMERQITAKLTADVDGDNKYFWHRPFDELVEQPGSREDLINAFCETLEKLLTRKTRIVQRKGWLFWHFRCECWEGETWNLIYRHFAFRGGKFKVPQIGGRRRVYQSDPVARGNERENG